MAEAKHWETTTAEGWETIVPVSDDENAPPSVRRLAVPGGWLYQVEHYVLHSEARGTVFREWHAPTYVPDKTNPIGIIEMMQRP